MHRKFSGVLSPTLRKTGYFFACLLLLTGYIVQINAASTKAYVLRDKTQIRDELVRTNKRLQAEIDRLQSLESIKERSAFLDLVPMGDVVYVQDWERE